MLAKRTIRYLIALLMFFIGMSLYLWATPENNKSDFMRKALPGIGIVISSALGVGLAVKFIERDIFPENVMMQVDNMMFRSGIVSFFVRRSDIDLTARVLDCLKHNAGKSEVFICGTSLSKFLPFNKDKIVMQSTTTKFRFMMLKPESPVAQQVGIEVGEPELPEQLKLQLKYLRDLMRETKAAKFPVQARTYDTIPFNCIVHVKTRKFEKLFLVIYLNSRPGDTCPVIEFTPSISTDRALLDLIVNCYGKEMWNKAEPVQSDPS